MSQVSPRRALTVCALLGCAFALSLASTLNPEPVPEPDYCDDFRSDGVSAVSVWHPREDRELGSEEIVQIVYGGQGGAMTPVRFELRGADVPSCALMTISVDRCEDLDCSQVDEEGGYVEEIPLKVYDEGGTRITRQFFYIFPFNYGPGDLIQAGISMNGSEHKVKLWLDLEGDFIDGGPIDGGFADAAPPLPDAELPDADLADADLADAALPDAAP